MTSFSSRIRGFNSPCVQYGGCPIQDGNGMCGEPNSLQISKEFKRLYEEKMAIIEGEGGDCLQEKLKLQQDWINDLTQQNEMLISVVQELEYEAIEKVQQLEEKLQESQHCLCEAERKLSDSDRTITEMQQKVKYYNSFGDIESMARQLRCKNEECESLKQIIQDRRKIFSDPSTDMTWSQTEKTDSKQTESSEKFLSSTYFTTAAGNSQKCVKGAASLLKIVNKAIESLDVEKPHVISELNKKLDDEKTGVKIDKKYVEQVESQLQDFLREKEEMKRKKKQLEKKCSLQDKEKESLTCECQKLKQKFEQMQNKVHEYENLKHEFEKLQNEKCQCKHLSCVIDCLTKEKESLKQKNEELLEDNRKTVGALVTLNEENRNLSSTIDNIRKRTNKTTNLTSTEISQINTTIEELQTNLEKTRYIQDQEEKSYQDTITRLNQTICKLEGQLKTVFNKCTSDKSVFCTKGKSKVSFLDTSGVQVTQNVKYEKELNEVLDINAKMNQELKRKCKEMEFLKDKVAKLENALVSCEERAANLQQAVDHSLDSIEILVSSEEEISNEFWMQSKDYEILQNISVALETEHFENLETIEMLNCQVIKYKQLLKAQEQENSQQIKKLAKQKRCYEEIVNYFKDEISVMADQLSNLQTLLTKSNESAHEESQKYINAFMEMQNLNSKLSEQLCLCQQDINNHDETIDSIRKKLQCSLQQNQELQHTIIQLNETIIELQTAIKIHEKENCAISQSARECRLQLDRYSETLDELKQGLKEKASECEKFKKAYFNEKTAVKELQNELDETQRSLQNNQFDLISAVEDLKEKLASSEDNYNKMAEDHKELQAHLALITRKEAVKDQEIKRYRKIVGDLKKTMMDLNSELNKTLCQKEVKKMHKKTKDCGCKKNDKETDYSDICSCPCEVEFYQNMVDLLKNSVSDLQSKLAEAQAINKQLEDTIESKNEQIRDLEYEQKLKVMQSDECDCLINKLKLELEAARQNEKKYEEKSKQLEKEINQLKEEIQSKYTQLNEESKKCREINSSKCVQLVRVQEELHVLREEMALMIKKQEGFKKENAKLRAENMQLECTIQCLRDRSKEIQHQLIQYQNEICGLNGERDHLIRTNKELLHEFKTLQQHIYGDKNNQQKVTLYNQKHLEAEISILQAEKNDICAESKNVISNVQAWLSEQKKVISFLIGKQNDIAQQNKNLKEQIRELQTQKAPRSSPKPINRPGYSRPKRLEVCSPVSLGSQGMASVYDQDNSLPASPCPNDMCDWYSSNFRPESDCSDDEEFCVNRLNSLTEEMKKSNKLWKEQNRGYSPADYGVSRDKK